MLVFPTPKKLRPVKEKGRRRIKRRKPLRSHKGLATHKRLMAKKPINKRSPKMKKLVPKLTDLYTKLRRYCHNRSELSGKRPDWRSDGFVEPHHIDGRIGDRLLDPFNLIMLTADEHDTEQQHRPGCHTKEELFNIVRPIRLKQGFKEE
jgi:hypothetical protein